MNTILKVTWNLIFNISGLDISFGARYYDWSFYLIELRANYPAVKELLAEKHLTPKEITPGETRLQIVGCEMRKVQIAGPYKEVSIQVPVEPLDGSPNGKFTHLFLPVNTERSRWPGVDIWGFPKFIANIDIKTDNNRIVCRLAVGDQLILEFKINDKAGSRNHYKWDYYGIRKQQIVKTTMDPEGFISDEESSGDESLVLGEHAVADTLREILFSNDVVRTMIGHNVSSILKKPVRIKFK
jgi:Acetoacetate decarboxylase (ADC)